MALATGGLAPRRQASPLLPDPVPDTPQQRAGAPPLADGCYLIHYTPTLAFSLPLAYEGTLRVETKTGRAIASGDLYERLFDLTTDPLTFVSSPDPKAGIPIFPIDRYRCYLRVTDLLATDGGFNLTFEALQPLAASLRFLNGDQKTWLVEDVFTARMGPAPADIPPRDPAPPPNGGPPPDNVPPNDPLPPSEGFPPPAAFPSPELVFVGDVTTGAGTTVGTLKMGFVSRHLRKATVELNRVAQVEFPRGNGAGETWQTIFDKVGWDITLSPGDSDVAHPSGESWSAGEADAAMQASRAKVDLNKVWHYDILAVRRIKVAHMPVPPDPEHEKENGERGYMYDRSINMQRLGLMIASDWTFPDTERWGLLRKMSLGATAGYFRTAVHELGHEIGRAHV